MTLDELAEKIDRVERLLAPRSDAEAAAHAAGLLSYEDLQDRLTVGLKNPRRPCMRTVRGLVAKHRRVIRPVEIGHTLVGFRERSVEKLLALLAGEEPAGGRRL